MKKVAIVGTVGIPASYGGFETLVENLTKYSTNEIKYYVFCSSEHYSVKIDKHNDAQLVYLPVKANGLQSVCYDIMSMIYSIFLRTDVILILGVSGCFFLPILKIFSSAKIITNIDGMEWRRNKWGWLAKKFLKFSENVAIKYSDVIITDNQAISDYVNAEYRKENLVIAYGGDHAWFDNTNCSSEDSKTDDYYFSICRIEPENNVSMILESFAMSGRKLKFMGNWHNSGFGRELHRKYKDYSNIELLDPVYDINILFVLRSRCCGYIHGHSAGGTNPSLVEAMHFSKPIFAFDCDFNRYTTENMAFYFHSAYSLQDGISLFEKGTLLISGPMMKKIANEKYTWEVIVGMYEACILKD